MLLITYATHNSGYLDALSVSSKRMGFELIILGKEKKWGGFMQKIFDILAFLKTKNMNEIVCFVDGFDVLTLGTQDEFLNKFKSFNTDKVIFSTTKDNIILEIIFGKINVNDVNFEYNRLCSGAYVGYCKKIIELFESICEINKVNNKDDDQEYLSVCYSKCKDCLQLDYQNDLFYCVETDGRIMEYINIIQGKQPYVELDNKFYFFKDNRLILKKNNSKPVFIQGNGNLNMDVFAKKLELPLNISNNRNYYDYSTKTFVYKIFKLLLGYIIMIIHLIFNITIIFSPYITNNIYILLGIILINVFILSQWYLLGSCFLNGIENKLLSREDAKYNNGTEKSSFLYLFEKYFGESNSYTFFSLVPLINSTYSTYKIISILNKKNIPFKFKIFDKSI